MTVVYCIFSDVIYVKFICNFGASSVYLGCTLMEDSDDWLVPCWSYNKPRFGGEGMMAKAYRCGNPTVIFVPNKQGQTHVTTE